MNHNVGCALADRQTRDRALTLHGQPRACGGNRVDLCACLCLHCGIGCLCRRVDLHNRAAHIQFVLCGGNRHRANAAVHGQRSLCACERDRICLRLRADCHRGRSVHCHGTRRRAAGERHVSRTVDFDRVHSQVIRNDRGIRTRSGHKTRGFARQLCTRCGACRRSSEIDHGKTVFIFKHNLARRGDVRLDGLVQQRHGGGTVDVRTRGQAVCAHALHDAHLRKRGHVAGCPVRGFAAVHKTAQIRVGVRRQAHRAGEHGHCLLAGNRRLCMNVFAVAFQNAGCGAAQHSVGIPLAAAQVVIAVFRAFGQAEQTHEDGCQLAAGERVIGTERAVPVAVDNAMLHPTVNRLCGPAVCSILHERTLLLRRPGGDRQRGQRHCGGQDRCQRFLDLHTFILLIGRVCPPPADGWCAQPGAAPWHKLYGNSDRKTRIKVWEPCRIPSKLAMMHK